MRFWIVFASVAFPSRNGRYFESNLHSLDQSRKSTAQKPSSPKQTVCRSPATNARPLPARGMNDWPSMAGWNSERLSFRVDPYISSNYSEWPACPAAWSTMNSYQHGQDDDPKRSMTSMTNGTTPDSCWFQLCVVTLEYHRVSIPYHPISSHIIPYLVFLQMVVNPEIGLPLYRWFTVGKSRA